MKKPLLMQIKIIGTRKLFSKPLPRHMKKFASILFLFITLNLFGQTPAPLAIKPSTKYTLQIDAGLNYFRYSEIPIIGSVSNPIASHYEALTIVRELNPTFSISLSLRNTNYGRKQYIYVFDGTNYLTPVTHQWNYWTIQTPIQIKVKPFQSKKLSLNAGGYLGFNYYNSESTSSEDFKVRHDNYKNILDIGVVVGIDYNWYKKGEFSIGNSLTYFRGYPYLSPFTYTRRAQGMTIGCSAKWGL